MDSTAGIVVGAFFGSLFLLTCLISAVKAVRDRKRIKARIAQREQEKLENGTMTNSTKLCAEENECRSPPHKVAVDKQKEKSSGNGHLTGTVHLSHPKDINSSYSSSNGLDNLAVHGVDNLTFERSFVDIPLADESQETIADSTKESNRSSPFNPDCASSPVSYHVVKETQAHTVCKPFPNETEHAKTPITSETHRNKLVSHESVEKQVELKHLPPECLAVKKLLRRHSYELAVSDYSWLPDNSASYASCVEITNVYNHGYRHKEKKYSLGCENRAFDKDDHKRSFAF